MKYKSAFVALGLEQLHLSLQEEESVYGEDRDVAIGGIAGALVHGTGGRYWTFREFTSVLPVEVSVRQRGEELDCIYFFPGISITGFLRGIDVAA